MTIAWNSIVRKRTKEEYSDAEYLLGLANNNVSIQNTLYKNWRKYFDDNYSDSSGLNVPPITGTNVPPVAE